MPDIPLARKRRTPEERRAEIMQAAITLFARQGYARTATKEIAAEAGLSEGTIFKYFATKQDILLAFIQTQAITQLPRVLLAMSDADDELRMREIILERLQIWNENHDLMRVIIGEALFNPELASGLHATLTPFFQILEDYFARRIAEGAFREVNPRLASRALIGYCWTYFLLWRTLLFPEMDQADSQPDTVQEILDLFLKGVLKPGGSEV